jgi:hypothetical protein
MDTYVGDTEIRELEHHFAVLGLEKEVTWLDIAVDDLRARESRVQ